MQWKAEERRMTQVVAALTAAREQKAREYARAEQNERETKEEVQVRRRAALPTLPAAISLTLARAQLRHLTILDLTKRSTEIGNRLKEFFALYEVVKVRPCAVASLRVAQRAHTMVCARLRCRTSGTST